MSLSYIIEFGMLRSLFLSLNDLPCHAVVIHKSVCGPMLMQGKCAQIGAFGRNRYKYST